MELNEFGKFLRDLLGESKAERISTFEDEGLLTRDEGLVVVMSDKSKFYITIQEAYK